MFFNENSTNQEQRIMHRKNLIYVTVFGKKDYIKLLNLLLLSLFASNDGFKNKFTLLIITSNSFYEMNKNYLSTISSKVEVVVWKIEEKSEIFYAAFSRYEIFRFDNINDYEKVLYLDTDILINGDISVIFDEILNDETINCLGERLVLDPSDYWGRSLFLQYSPELFIEQQGYSSGAIFFKNTARVEYIFGNILNKGFDDKARGIVYDCLDQPYLNFYGITMASVTDSIMKKYMVNNPIKIYPGMLINHFPGGPGNYSSKFSKMSKFLLKILRDLCPGYSWGDILNSIFLHDQENQINLTLISKKISVININDGSSGFLFSTPINGKYIFLTLPDFDISIIDIPKNMIPNQVGSHTIFTTLIN